MRPMTQGNGAIRQNFRREWVSALTFPLALSLLEGGVVGVLADKVFGVHRILIAVLVAAPAFANVTSLYWTRLVHARPKVPFIVSMYSALLVLVAGVGFIPKTPVGGVLLTVLAIAARCLVCGIVTVRSTIWRMNYPRAVRGRISGRIALTGTIMMAVMAFVWGAVLDAGQDSFRLVYPVAAAIAVIGIVAFSRVKMHRESVQLDAEDADRREGEATPEKRRSALAVLRSDPLYSRYLTWQFVMGSANLMLEPVVVYFLSRELNASYAVSIALSMGIPMGLAALTLPVWASYIDRVHVVRFRVIHSGFWVVAHVLTGLGALRGDLILMGLGRAIIGVGRGGGMLAWQLGHHDFAERRLVTLYMGIHVTLTGMRGAVMPLVGMIVYAGWGALALPFGWVVPAFAGIGPVVFFVGGVLAAIGGLGFYSLSRQMLKPESG